MRKTFLILAIGMFLTYAAGAQGIKSETKDPDVSRMELNERTKTPLSVLFKDEATFREAEAQSLFAKYLSLRPGIDELRYTKRDAADHITVTRYQQYYKGLKVEQGSYVMTAKDGKVSFITGDFYNIDPASSSTPVISEQEALAKAWNYIDGAQPAFNDAAPAELVYSANNFAAVPDGKAELAYKFFLSSHKTALRMEYICVSAVSGKILYTNTLLNTGCMKPAATNKITAETTPVENCEIPALQAQQPTVIAGTAATRYSGNVTNLATQLSGGSYKLQTAVATEGSPTHTRNLNHALVNSFTTVTQFNNAIAASTEITDADNNWTLAEYDNANFDNTALDASWGAQRVYDYWNTRHSRLSWNNANGVLNMFVHGDNNWDNAFWQGSGGINSMFYGDGSNVVGGFLTLTALDVTGHEIGHGVCQSTSNLTYSKESGGMNEGFSDIWGASIEHFADPHETDATAKSYFDIGEEIGLPLPNNPLRSMSNPKAHAQPDTYLGMNWVSTTTPTDVGGDNWGVHTNSGVLNHWFYLLVSGGSGTNDNGNTFAVPALGWVDAEHITFLGEQNLTTSATYASCRTAMINAATTLFGACSLQTEAVTRAWYAVGVGANFVPCVPQIGFRDVALTTSENAGVAGCPATKTVTVRMMIEGAAAPTGGNATATVTATGTATNGVDYTIGTGTATFAAGSTADQNITLNIIDDAAVEPNENIKLDFTVTPNGSNATKTNAYQSSVITIIDNDTIPELGSNVVTNFVGSATITNNLTSPFKAATKAARSQFIYTAAELTAAGVRPNVPISAIAFQVTTKNSTQAYTGYTVSYANTAQTSMTAYVGSLTTAYSGNYTTAVGTNSIALTTPIIWDGTNNLVLQCCFTNATAGTANDLTNGFTANTTNYTGYGTANTAGCTIAAIAFNTSRPYISFTQTIPAVKVETTLSATRAQRNNTSASNYYYATADNGVIAGITASNQDLGCLSATITQAGVGFVPFASFANTKRSVKEITITPTLNTATANYNATIYFTDAELAGKSTATLSLVKTDAVTDAQVNAGNTVIITPTVIAGTNWKGFTGNFTGFSRFFLVDNPVLAVTGLIANAYLQNGHVNISWKTQTESNSSHFEIERSYDGVNFTKILDHAAAGNSSTERQYAVTDGDIPHSINYYRVTLVNIDGSRMSSPIVSVKTGSKALIAVMPNPVHDQFAIQYSNTGKSVITILDATGRKMQQLTPAGSSGSISVDGSSFAPGVYIVMLTDDKDQTITQKFIKQ